MPADFTKIGIQSVGLTLAQKFDIEKKLEEKVLLDKDGKFSQGDARDPIFEFSIEGKGDLPEGLALGSNGGAVMGDDADAVLDAQQTALGPLGRLCLAIEEREGLGSHRGERFGRDEPGALGEKGIEGGHAPAVVSTGGS